VPALPAPRVVLGFQGAQMPANARRGIGRWSHELTLSLLEHRRDLLAAVSVDPDLPLPPVVDELPLDLPVLVSSQPPADVGDAPVLFHALSLLEDLPIGRIWPRWAREPGVSLVATVYDLIPLRHPEDHFPGALRHLLRARHALLTSAAGLAAISITTAGDTARLLGYPRDRISVVYGSVAPRVRPHPDGSRAAWCELPAELGVRPGFVLSVGNVEPRKNLPGLIRAYAELPAQLRRYHQLVLTCGQGREEDLDRLRAVAECAGVAADVVVLGYVDDATLARLYQACTVMAFPSLEEGLGLPALEAMRSGALVLASDVGAVREVVRDPRARFDPTSLPSMTGALHAALTDPALDAELRAAQHAMSLTFGRDRMAAAAARLYHDCVAR
jgi:glycosyltransferase involved in cell wall biosynthesis